ncbi:uncharacterized protein LOC126764447 [Bactrocera neohumeralis]|uniref:uncharacterized protein LOC126764447 n=1 Tax=Bactrocera neohumeralis TaxID=98809 RepID=UPI002166A1A1|nr:uncharacterized protein LOC126764447 [Bactrocera neohumeralis]
MIVVKIYSHFYLFTVRVAKLKKFCESVDVEYKKLIGYSKTRFLGLLSSVDSILRIFDGLKEYFLGDPNTPNSLLLFFEDPRAKMWLLFLRDQASIFNRTVKARESDNINAMEVGHALNSFVQSLESRKKEAFLSATVQKEMEHISAVDERVSKEAMQDLSRQFYGSNINLDLFSI